MSPDLRAARSQVLLLSRLVRVLSRKALPFQNIILSAKFMSILKFWFSSLKLCNLHFMFYLSFADLPLPESKLLTSKLNNDTKVAMYTWHASHGKRFTGLNTNVRV